jgi:glycosyltransferase involved in cell wall biosynthesis
VSRPEDAGVKVKHVAFLTPLPWSVAYGGREVLVERTIQGLASQNVDAFGLDWWRRDSVFDILHVVGADAGAWEPAARAKALGARVVVTAVLSIGSRFIAERAWRHVDSLVPMKTSFRYRRDLLRLAHAVIAATSAEARVLTDVFDVPSSCIHVIPPGVDEVFFEADSTWARKRFGSSPYLLSVGTINTGKGQLELVEAARRVGIRVILVGDIRDPNDPSARAVLRSVRSAEVELVTGIDSEELASLYAGCAAFVLASRREGLPISALEAAAAGCRLVLGGLFQLREAFGSTASYAAPGDASSLASAITMELEQPRKRAIDIPRSWSEIAAMTSRVYDVIPS